MTPAVGARAYLRVDFLRPLVTSSPSDLFAGGAGPDRYPESDRTDLPLDPEGTAPLDDARRDGIDGLLETTEERTGSDAPYIVSISDVHGYLNSARNALLALDDHPDLPPIVTADDEGTLHWADENYVLVFNGDLVDRGPASAETIELAARLLEEAPDGRVRIVLGNHEMGFLTPGVFGWRDVYSCDVDREDRLTFLRSIQRGHVVAAYEGYDVTYAHAGQPDAYEVVAANDELVAAADRLGEHLADEAATDVEAQLVEDHPLVLGLGSLNGRGPGAGLVWLDFRHMPPDAPKQVVGHSRQDRLTADGAVLCENVIRNNLHHPGGEAVTVETPDGLYGLTRERDGEVTEESFDLDPPG